MRGKNCPYLWVADITLDHTLTSKGSEPGITVKGQEHPFFFLVLGCLITVYVLLLYIYQQSS